MREGNLYKHFNGGEYYYCGIALLKSQCLSKQLVEINLAYDAHTPKGEETRRVQLYVSDGIMLIDREVPHVVYQSEKDYGTDKVHVRTVEEFFGYKFDELGNGRKRFTLIG